MPFRLFAIDGGFAFSGSGDWLAGMQRAFYRVRLLVCLKHTSSVLTTHDTRHTSFDFPYVSSPKRPVTIVLPLTNPTHTLSLSPS